MRCITNPVRKLMKTGSASKYPIKENIPRAKQIIAAISRLRGGFDVFPPDCVLVVVFDVLLPDDDLELLFFPVV